MTGTLHTLPGHLERKRQGLAGTRCWTTRCKTPWHPEPTSPPPLEMRRKNFHPKGSPPRMRLADWHHKNAPSRYNHLDMAHQPHRQKKARLDCFPRCKHNLGHGRPLSFAWLLLVSELEKSQREGCILHQKYLESRTNNKRRHQLVRIYCHCHQLCRSHHQRQLTRVSPTIPTKGKIYW